MPMLLLVDSGGTKTHWRLITDQNQYESLITPGINPYYQDSEQIHNDLKNNLTEKITGQDVSRLFFYGAGCSVKDKQEIVGDALKKVFKNAELNINGDLLGTARALCHNDPGIACVIGTGSGSCQYDGKNIIANIPSLGFIMGDEGSGAYLGKHLIQDYLRGDMPQKIITRLREQFEISKEIVLENVNRRPMPSRYLGSFSEFIHENLSNEYIIQLVHKSFDAFIRRYIIKYPDYINYKACFAGSIAYYFSNELSTVLNQYNIKIGEITDSPMEGLMKYHLENLP